MLRRLLLSTFLILTYLAVISQTTLTEAENFHVKTIDGEPIWLFPLLDNENQIVVIDFFSTTCGPCQDYAPDFQACYENFGMNQGNVYFMGINWGNDNQGVREFDSIFGLTYPSISGSQGGGNIVYQNYDIQSYPTVIVITPDHNIVEQYVWPPDEQTLTAAIIAAGGIVGIDEDTEKQTDVLVYPNPVSDMGTVQVRLKHPAKVSMKLYNLLGVEVFSSGSEILEKGINNIRIDVSGFPNGYYFLKMESHNGFMSTTRISVSK